jgi:hypothetical protein
MSSPPTFQLRSPIDFDLPPVDLSAAQAGALIRAKNKLIAAIELEETYLALVEDFIEFETSVFNASIKHTVRLADLDDHFHDLRRTFNRRIMHVLSVARSYIHSVDRAVSHITSDSERLITSLGASRSQQYDALLGYRVMEALRNSAQHHGLPLHGLTVGGRWLHPGESLGERMHIYTVPTFTTHEFEGDSNFNKRVLRELEELGSKHDVRLYLREYIMGLSYVHQDFHSLTVTDLESAELTIVDAIESWTARYSQLREPQVLCLSTTDNGTDDVYLMRESVNRRRQLERDSPALVNLHLAVVSGSTDIKVS